MKIVILQGAFLPVPPVEGGAVEKIWYRMGREFAARGNEVIHISKACATMPDYEISASVLYKRVKGYTITKGIVRMKILDFLYTRRAIRLIPPDVDIIVTNTFWAPLLLRGKLKSKAYISVERMPRGQMKLYRHAGVIRACSIAIQKAIEKEISFKYFKRISCIPNPVPFDVLSFKKQNQNNILYVGRLHPEKGIDVLVKAFRKIEKMAPEWNLIIVGPHRIEEGGGGEEYFQKLKAAAGESRIAFTGPFYDETVLASYFAKSSIFCYPLQDNSGDAAPVSPREAMAYGIVPVVSQLECFSDFIFDGINGLTFNQSSENQVDELGALLYKLVADTGYRAKLSLESRKIMNQFAPGKIAADFLKDFEKLIS